MLIVNVELNKIKKYINILYLIKSILKYISGASSCFSFKKRERQHSMVVKNIKIACTKAPNMHTLSLFKKYNTKSIMPICSERSVSETEWLQIWLYYLLLFISAVYVVWNTREPVYKAAVCRLHNSVCACGNFSSSPRAVFLDHK